MFDFDLSAILGRKVDELKPHAAGFGLELRAFGQRVIQLLEQVDENTRDEPFISTRVYIKGTAAASTNTGKLAAIPAGEQWEIEAVTLAANGIGGFRIFDNPQAGVGDGIVPPGIIPLWGGMTVNGGTVSLAGNGVIVPGGRELYVVSNSPCDFTIQCRRKVVKPARRARFLAVEVPTDGDEATPNPEPERHDRTWTTDSPSQVKQ